MNAGTYCTPKDVFLFSLRFPNYLSSPTEVDNSKFHLYLSPQTELLDQILRTDCIGCW